MQFKRGDTCFILEDNSRTVQAKVVGKQEDTYIVQLIGACGALRLSEENLFATREEAAAGKKTSSATVSSQLSGHRSRSGVTEIKIPDVRSTKK